jgi:hypothetical protein
MEENGTNNILTWGLGFIAVFVAVSLLISDTDSSVEEFAPVDTTELQAASVENAIQSSSSELTPVKAFPNKPAKTKQCHPSYSGCLNPNASDYDCAGGSGNGPYYTGTVQVYGYDEFGLDRDGDGWGCE